MLFSCFKLVKNDLGINLIFKNDDLKFFSFFFCEFRSITRSYYRNSVGALFLYDITNYESFVHTSDWLEEARKQIEPNNAIFMLVGTKIDKDHIREVQTMEAQQFADYHNLLFIETSSKSGHNVEKGFNQIGSEIYRMLEEGKFKVQEGWDGIKSGYIRTHATPAPSLQLTEQKQDNNRQQQAKKSCCS